LKYFSILSPPSLPTFSDKYLIYWHSVKYGPISLAT
jgi:hypothetical protein